MHGTIHKFNYKDKVIRVNKYKWYFVRNMIPIQYGRCLKMVSAGALVVAGVALICCGFCALSAGGEHQDTLEPSHIPDVGLKEDYELVMVHTVSRHGERTPADTFPTDPNINNTFYPYGWGMLTNKGRQHMYHIGDYFRQRYNSLLGDYYVESRVYAESTGANRARMSVALILAGMYPPKGTPLDWNSHLNWQPIPFFSQDLDKDNLLLVRLPCPRYSEAVEEVIQMPETKLMLSANQIMMRALTELTGKSVTTPDDIQDIYSTLKAEEGFGAQLPDWTKQYYPHLMHPLMVHSYILNSYTKELIRLKGGVFLKKLFKDWNAARSGESVTVMNVFGGHDSSVVNVARALGVWEPQEPDYGITLLVELYRERLQDEYYVQIHLVNSTLDEPYTLLIPNCDVYCPLDKVIKLRSSFIADNWDAECIPHDLTYVTPPPSGP